MLCLCVVFFIYLQSVCCFAPLTLSLNLPSYESHLTFAHNICYGKAAIKEKHSSDANNKYQRKRHFRLAQSSELLLLFWWDSIFDCPWGNVLCVSTKWKHNKQHLKIKAQPCVLGSSLLYLIEISKWMYWKLSKVMLFVFSNVLLFFSYCFVWFLFPRWL